MVGVVSGVQAQSLSPKSLYNQASQQFWDGQYRQAESTYRTLVNRYPEHSLYWDARFGLAKSLYEQGKLGAARSHFQAVRRNHSRKSVRGDALFSLAEISILTNHIIRAQEFLRTFIDLFPNHVLIPTARDQLKLLREVDRSTPPTNTDTADNRSSKPAPEETTKRVSKNPQLKPADPGARETSSVINPLETSEVDTPPEKPVDRGDTPDSPPGKVVSPQAVSGVDPKSMPNGRISPFGNASDSPTIGDRGKNKRDPDTKATVKEDEGSTETSNNESGPDTQAVSAEPADTTGGKPGAMEANRPDTPAEAPSKISRGDTNRRPTKPKDESPVKNVQERSEPAQTNDRQPSGLNRARSLYEQGKYDQARQAIDAVLDESPGRPGPYRLALKIYREVPGRSDRFLDLLNKTIQLADEPVRSLSLEKTTLLLEQGRYQEALASLKRLNTSEFSGEEQEARYHYLRGKIALGLGNDDEAFFHFMDAVRASPSSKWAERAQSTISDKL